MKQHLTIAAAITLMILAPLCPAQADNGKKQTRQLTGAQSAKPKSAVTEKLIGSWKLVSIETIRPNGEIIYDWMGRQPTGLTVYESAGRMSVQIMRDPRPTFDSNDNAKATPEEKARAYDGYYAYYGTYQVNEAESTVMHHVQSSLRPTEVGIDYQRYFKLSGDRIVLTTTRYQEAGEQRTNRPTWERVK